MLNRACSVASANVGCSNPWAEQAQTGDEAELFPAQMSRNAWKLQSTRDAVVVGERNTELAFASAGDEMPQPHGLGTFLLPDAYSTYDLQQYPSIHTHVRTHLSHEHWSISN